MTLFSLFLFAAVSAVIPYGDVEIKSVRLDYARPSNTLGYSAIVVNNGPVNAEAVELIALLPLDAAVRNAEPSCVASGARLRCALGTLQPGEERRVFMLLLTAMQRPQIVAFASSETPDPNGLNNVRPATTP